MVLSSGIPFTGDEFTKSSQEAAAAAGKREKGVVWIVFLPVSNREENEDPVYTYREYHNFVG